VVDWTAGAVVDCANEAAVHETNTTAMIALFSRRIA